MDERRWDSGGKEAVAEAFEQARDELRGEIDTKLDDHPTKDQVAGIVDGYFEERLEQVRPTGANTS